MLTPPLFCLSFISCKTPHISIMVLEVFRSNTSRFNYVLFDP